MRHRRRRIALEPGAERGEGAAGARRSPRAPARGAGRLDGSTRRAATGSSRARRSWRRPGRHGAPRSPGTGGLERRPPARPPPGKRPGKLSRRPPPAGTGRSRPRAGPACPRAAMPPRTGARLRLELLDGELLVRVDQVEQVVRRPWPGPRPWAWPCRCPCRGRPPWNRPRRTRRMRPAAPPGPPRRRQPTFPMRWGRPAHHRRCRDGRSRRAGRSAGQAPTRSTGGDRDAHPMGRRGGHRHELAGEVVGGGAGDPDLGIGAGRGGRARSAGSGRACSGGCAR